jgi:PIN domain nuclease of toxin-antitoxin system
MMAFDRVLDASALLAFFRGERGADAVEPLIDGSAISAVNWAETMQILQRRKVATGDWRADLEALGIPVIPFSAEHAEATADLWGATQEKGLSLGDRACLALAKITRVQAITADSTWRGLAVGVEITIIR